jgi:peptide methionine sulfoxide reductase MsrA
MSYRDILLEFFSQHSPTSPAYSKQYRSAIFYHSPDQRRVAEELIGTIESKGRKIYTDVEPATDFYRAEEYHLKYIEKANKGRW